MNGACGSGKSILIEHMMKDYYENNKTIIGLIGTGTHYNYIENELDCDLMKQNGSDLGFGFTTLDGLDTLNISKEDLNEVVARAIVDFIDNSTEKMSLRTKACTLALTRELVRNGKYNLKDIKEYCSDFNKRYCMATGMRECADKECLIGTFKVNKTNTIYGNTVNVEAIMDRILNLEIMVREDFKSPIDNKELVKILNENRICLIDICSYNSDIIKDVVMSRIKLIRDLQPKDKEIVLIIDGINDNEFISEVTRIFTEDINNKVIIANNYGRLPRDRKVFCYDTSNLYIKSSSSYSFTSNDVILDTLERLEKFNFVGIDSKGEIVEGKLKRPL